MKRRWLVYPAITVFGVIADLWTKSHFFNHPGLCGPDIVIVDGFFNISCKMNPVFAFGIGPSNPTLVALLHISAFGAIGYLLYHLRDGNWMVRTALACIFAGAIGNLYDRLSIGKVRDFIDWHTGQGVLGKWCYETLGTSHWPTFNIADSLVSVGATVIVISLLFAPKPVPSSKRADVKR